MKKLHLFEGFGVELEYMIVDRDTLDVRPVTDTLMHDKCGAYRDEWENGAIAWNNELALHVFELKTNGPAPALNGLTAFFHDNIREANSLLATRGARLMPGAMHPWMDPHTELRLWPHEHNLIYEMYNRIFDCRGHGWANLQSTHLNLPFGNDREFGRLHAAIRLVLPLLPALAASSPVADARLTGWADTRLREYQGNQKRIPSIAGMVIPEPVFTEKEYRSRILARNYADIVPFDPDGILQDEWLNSRGAIARFQRSAIEIRVLDIQECPLADIALLKVIVQAIRELVDERHARYSAQKQWQTGPLYAIFQDGVRLGSRQVIDDAGYLALFGIHKEKYSTLRVWESVIERTPELEDPESAYLRMVLEKGNLSARIREALGPDPGRPELAAVYGRLSGCLADNVPFS